MRLFRLGQHYLTHPYIQQKSQSFFQALQQTTQQVCRFSLRITSFADLTTGNSCVIQCIRNKTLSEIHSSPQYSAYAGKISEGDLRYISINKNLALQKLKEHQFLHPDNTINSSTINHPEVKSKLITIFSHETTAIKIYEILKCIEYRSSRQALQFRITQTKILDPQILSNMSLGGITVQQAGALIVRCRFTDAKDVPLVDLQKGEFYQGLPAILRKSKNPPKLCLISPSNTFPTQTEIDDAFSQDVDELTEPPDPFKKLALQIQKKLSGLLYPFSSKVHFVFYSKFVKHLKIQTFFNPLNFYDWFFGIDRWCNKWAKALRRVRPKNKEYVLAAFDNRADVIHRYLKSVLPLLAQTIATKPLIDFDPLSLKQEERQKIVDAHSVENLPEIFDRYQHILDLFLKYSTETFTLSSPIIYQIEWELDGICVLEILTRETDGAIARRLQFPVTGTTSRTDLVYFSSKPQEDSVEKRWNSIKTQFGKTDIDLANDCLALMRLGHIQAPQPIKQFLVPLVILLFGKEASVDPASIFSNYILMLSVSLGLMSFCKALETMPMIPRGAISAKQFLLHVTHHPVDSLSHVQHKDTKNVQRSYYLPHTQNIVGNADKWTQKYDDVVTAAIACAGELLKQQAFLSLANPDVAKLKELLDKFYDKDIPIDELAEALENERYLIDDDDAIGEWALNFISKVHPLHHTS
ncbi:MAG: hypothetical protein JSR58_02925 [Verrucomicrobia bacterium]|nr:hypothetical protein [Verrucomicrobiota bacterium]